MLKLAFDLDVDTRGPNAREHWSETARRRGYERRLALLVAKSSHVRPLREEEIATVAMTRRSSRTMDDDNLAAALKAVRDGIADALGVDDGDLRVTWRPRQEHVVSKRGKRGVHVEIHYDEELKGAP